MAAGSVFGLAAINHNLPILLALCTHGGEGVECFYEKKRISVDRRVVEKRKFLTPHLPALRERAYSARPPHEKMGP